MRPSLLICAILASGVAALRIPSAKPLAPACAVPAARHAPAAMLATKKVKQVQVVLSKAVEGLGKEGDLVSVKQAYANNFLVTKGLGKVATPDVLKRIKAEQARRDEEAAAAKTEAEENSKALQAVFGGQGLFVKKKVGRDGAIFGSVTPAEVAELIRERSGLQVDKKSVQVPSMNAVGTGMAEVTLHRDVVAKVKLTVVPATM